MKTLIIATLLLAFSGSIQAGIKTDTAVLSLIVPVSEKLEIAIAHYRGTCGHDLHSAKCIKMGKHMAGAVDDLDNMVKYVENSVSSRVYLELIRMKYRLADSFRSVYK